MNVTSNNFYSAMSLIDSIYGISISPTEFEELGYIAWGKIGNKRTLMRDYITIPVNDRIILPEDLDIIEGVYLNSTLVYSNTDYSMTANENKAMEQKTSPRVNQAVQYSRNVLLKNYYIADGCLIFTEPMPYEVKVMYKSILSDSDDLPYINDLEAEAIAVYCVYVYFMKKFNKTKDKMCYEQAQIYEKEWKQKLNRARRPETLNHNDLDDIMKTSVRCERKKFGQPFKIRK